MEQVVGEGQRRRRSHSTEVGRGMGGLGGRITEERIGLSTAGGQFLFKTSNGFSELAFGIGW